MDSDTTIAISKSGGHVDGDHVCGYCRLQPICRIYQDEFQRIRELFRNCDVRVTRCLYWEEAEK